MEPVWERVLWRHVILRAQDEAIGKFVYGGDAHAIKHHARRWLSTRSKDLHDVCRLAGLSEEKTEQLLQGNIRRYGKRRNSK